MDGKRLIEKIRLRNILSFGDKGGEIELLPLNIIIGQNASGKSNLVDVIKLLRSLPQDKGLVNFISRSGGIGELIWKGKTNNVLAEIKVSLLRVGIRTIYEIGFGDAIKRIGIAVEKIYDDVENAKINERETGIHSEESILAPEEYRKPTKNYGTAYSTVRSSFLNFKVFDNLETGRKSEIRSLQLADLPNDFLDEDAGNLNLVLNDLEYRGNFKSKIVENLKKFNPRIKDYSIRVIGGTLQLNIYEEGLNKPISALRLSDGTLRYLYLLTILCHPEPPPLICIEEPETGLHPDILPTVAELMIEASQRTQLIVTTHSDILVSAFSEIPEAVLVCEKDDDGTHFKRLEKDKLKSWLEEYSLGEVWLKGEIGGTRW